MIVLKVQYKLSLTKNFHKYETKRKGDNNTEYALANILQAQYKASDKLALNAAFLNSSPWSYKGGKKADAYEIELSAGYDITKNFAASIGHTYSAASTNSSGTELNIQIADEYGSTVFTTLDYTF